ncbi:MAG: acetyl-CoA carboxylase biotin carboxylase subunit [Rhodothermaceae bacterium]|nr:acetyl-CoA carboxylase biotin carboxylase subunit [Bacteroidota bacterium]MXW15698.1 acetyl-CoA carboxylase biotin carboxylase subunit [Rhodothermaceae bacterium]MDE2646398.1 acetyl-CoA carboxylase biotin carboxylase subunit [Bacteroidota bacterium]MXW33633.1 acetyl-CoA carboxylase biotin carboxylase subunit [Rhodothermaceae bacterium]MXX96603.1 acetyl-CoA carboxylase biotin carboxylase subunit [Rhodothermaceae bacterium]
MKRISKILIANRGEIALRIMRTCKVLGIRSVAIYSEVDRRSAHVVYADEAYCVGPAPSVDSYLNLSRIMDAVKESGADAVHPGYGFLSERAELAGACEDQGVVFIGPSAHTISDMGDKMLARELMQTHDVPVVPGTEGAVTHVDEALAIADQIGYPVLAKAAAGGGGKGMRKVNSAQEMEQALDRAQGEAGSAFGDARIFIEKYLENPRHIEFQILADAYGKCIHLFERECSIQRRHQKVIEEAPCADMTVELRSRMGAAAIRAAQACKYVGAGTIEFLLDRDNNFYFMEMNTRLQVEHPVTEYITGLDLVAEQIRIAEGAPLPYEQNEMEIHGHAIECRIYAEDPESNFLPNPGMITFHQVPTGVGVRVDSGLEVSGEVPIYYDPMISKVITWGRTRDEATGRMIGALSDYQIAGVKTTCQFCRRVMQSAAWQEARLSTHFVDEHSELLVEEAETPTEAAAVTTVLLQRSNPPNLLATAWLNRRES